MIFYSIPNTRPPIIESCEATEDEVIFHTDAGVQRIAKERLSTNNLIDTYGGGEALSRYTASYGARPYAMKTSGIVIAIASTILCVAVPPLVLLSAFAWFVAYLGAAESNYEKENLTLCENVRIGLLNLRRIENLHIEQIDHVLLEDTLRYTQAIAHSALGARKGPPEPQVAVVYSLN